MKKSLKIVAITLCSLFLLTAFMPVGFALRGTTSDAGIKSSRTVEGDLKSINWNIKSHANSPDTKIAAKTADPAMRVRFDDVISEMKSPSRFFNDDGVISHGKDESLTSAVWDLNFSGKAMFYNSQNASLTRVSVGISSTSARTVSICAAANANGMMNTIGFTTMKIQRFYKSRWMTVSTISNVYSHNTSYFLYSTAKSYLVSGCYYRVQVTFFGDNGFTGTTVTKTSSAIRCK